MKRYFNFKDSIIGEFALVSFNVCLIVLLFSFFDLTFRFVRFILIYEELNYLWTLYSNYYSFITILFSCSWLLTSCVVTSYFFNKRKFI